jgi:hypothetical protein
MISHLLTLPMWQNVAGSEKLTARRGVPMDAGSAASAVFLKRQRVMRDPCVVGI